MFDIRENTKKLLDGCIIKAYDGTNMYTPDGMGNYRALWTRDFSYMVEYAGELIDKDDIRRGIEYLLAGADKNGWIPDRVEENGRARYTAGDETFPGLPNLDNGPFMIFLAENYLSFLPDDEANKQFKLWEKALCDGIDCLPVDKNCIVENNTTPPHSPYGFTDTVKKTGLLAMETLLLWRAMKKLVYLQGKAGSDSRKYEEKIRQIEENFADIFIDEDGIIRAATGVCNQKDIWASCFAVSISFPLTKEQIEKISSYMASNYDTLVYHGQIRHLPKGEYWEDTFVEVPEGEYQNGAFWATPTRWFFDTVRKSDKALAVKLINDILAYFENEGIYECVNGDYKKLDTYVASITCIYDLYDEYVMLKNMK